MVWKQLIWGLLTYIPGVTRVFGGGAGSTNSARYCYSVWLRHLVTGFGNGLGAHPKVVAEVGPGNSLGMGLAALISGATSYHALDVREDANVARNLKVFEELVALFQKRERIPDDQEFPQVRPQLDSYDFPGDHLSVAHMAATTASDRLERIRESIRHPDGAGSMIRYRVPWFDESVIEEEALDMVFSQAVLEHVDDLPSTYRTTRRWLKVGGLASHQIDFRSHQTAREWNGHWTYSDLAWKLIKGKRDYLLNREPCSTHLKLMAENGFTVVGTQLMRSASRIGKQDLAPRFSNVTDDDMTTSGALLQGIKRG